MLKSFVFLYILAANIWTGGHLIFALRNLLKARKNNDFGIIQSIESQFEPIGLPSLLVLAVTGIYFATQYSLDFFDFSSHYTKHIVLKLGLMLYTVLLAIHARLVLIQKKALKPLAVHIIAVTVVLVFVGFSSRSAGLL